MNEMQVFQDSEFGELGVLEINGKPYFPATACAKMLGYQRPQDTVRQHCRYSMKYRVPHPQNPNKEIGMNFIPEGDLYRLIIHSKLPAAERFEKWVFDTVLPSIRKTGHYGSPAADLTKLAEQMAQIAASMVAVVDKLSDLTDRGDGRQVNFPARYNLGQCKLESFPAEIVCQVDKTLKEMQERHSLNFSAIARYCTINGYTITSPAVKTYYQKRFQID